MNCKLIEICSYEYDTDLKMYRLLVKIVYWSPRYKKFITVPVGFLSDGVTWFLDLASISAWLHDWMRKTKKFDDGTPIACYQASMIFGDVLRVEGDYLVGTVGVPLTWIYCVWSW